MHVPLWPRVQRHEVANADVIADLHGNGEVDGRTRTGQVRGGPSCRLPTAALR